MIRRNTQRQISSTSNYDSRRLLPEEVKIEDKVATSRHARRIKVGDIKTLDRIFSLIIKKMMQLVRQ